MLKTTNITGRIGIVLHSKKLECGCVTGEAKKVVSPHLLVNYKYSTYAVARETPEGSGKNMVVVAAFGNPLLDITVKIPDKSLLAKYNLNEDDQKEISASNMKSLLHDISSLNPCLSPGGAAQNTMRILQWVLTKSHSTIMFGAIGKDTSGRSLKRLVEAAGVQTRYIEHEIEHTGTVVALVSGAYRSLVAYIGAAQHVQVENINPASISLLKTTNLVYMEGFFLTHRRKVAEYIHQICDDNKIIFTFNLSAVYMAVTYPEDVLYFAEKCDVLIGNFKEYEALIKAANLSCDVQSFATQLSRNYNNTKSLRNGKIIIITNGSKSVMCAHSDGKLEEIPVPKIDVSKIGDTTGAGDAFAAGFLGGMFAGQTPLLCLKWGCWVAQQIIQQIGCTIPDYPVAELLKDIK